MIGRIPGFTDAIFPADSIANLSNVANLGLILFLFIIGLEVDLRYFFSNWKVALSVGMAGLILPFALGCAISIGIYHQFSNEPGTEPVAYGTFMLFIGVAVAITAFPVLCRILTELKLLSTPVGIITLAAGVGNDVVGWVSHATCLSQEPRLSNFGQVLLALCVALVNSGSGITALYIILTAVAFCLFLTFVVRPGFMLVLRRTHSLQDGPTQGVMVLTVLIVCFLSGNMSGRQEHADYYDSVPIRKS